MASVMFRQGGEIKVAQDGTCGSVTVANSNVGAFVELVLAKGSACGCLAVAINNFGACVVLTMAKVVACD